MRRTRRLRAMSLRPRCPGGAWPGAEGGERPPGPGLTHGPAAAAAAAGVAAGAVPRPAPEGSAPPAAPARAAAAPRGRDRGSGGAGQGGARAGRAVGCCARWLQSKAGS